MNFWTRHLEEAEETYFQHMRFAMSFAGHMMVGAFACAVHAVAPFLFESTGSRRIKYLYERMVFARKELKNNRKGTALNISNDAIENVAAKAVE